MGQVEPTQIATAPPAASDATANIDAIEYVGTIETETVTPLGLTATQSVPCDSIRVTLTVGDVAGHWLYFRPEAIADRMHGYSVADEQVAIESLVRELVFGWSPQLVAADPADPVQVNGGADDRIAVTWTDTAKAAAGELLVGTIAARITAHHELLAADAAVADDVAVAVEPVAEPPLPAPPETAIA